MYSPTSGRFMQTDPIGYEDQFNLYAYVGNDPMNAKDPSGLGKACAEVTGSNIKSCVNFDADGDGDSKESNADEGLSRAQVRKIENHFAGFIRENRNADVGASGKPVTGDASESDKSIVRTVSQFVGYGLSGKDLARWKKDGPIIANQRSYFKTGPTAQYGFHKENAGATGQIMITGARNGWILGGYNYDSPSNLARALLHEIGHPRLSNVRSATFSEHHRIDRTAKAMLKSMGLDGGGCWGIGYSAGNFSGC